ncbi:hypothetical protein PLESTF_000255100 [Pleodorina starrii]|nr:hypothetical protein PLESTF_000255100 [Pleodorina starrii]
MEDRQVLEADAFLETVAQALTSLPLSPPPVQARDGDDENSTTGAPPAAVAVQRQPAGAAAAVATMTETAADRPAMPPQLGGAAAAASVAAATAPADALSVPPSFVCPISMTIMRDPVVLVESGDTFDWPAIKAHFRNSVTNPVTNLPLSSMAVVPNISLRDAIEEWLLEHGLTADQADALPSGGGPRTQAPAAAVAAAAAAASAAAAPATPDQVVVSDERSRRDVASARHEVMSPPSALGSLRMGSNVAVEGRDTVVRYINNVSHGQVGNVQADFPAPPSSRVYYFEVKIADAGANGSIALGYAQSRHPNISPVGMDEGSFALHGKYGRTFWETVQGDYYGFKFGTGDIVGAALDFQRKQIFFTKNGRPGKALPVKLERPLHPTVSIYSPSAEVSINLGQIPFRFDIEPYKIMVGSRVAIRNVSIDEARSIQANHGGWDPSMEKMLGKTGTVVAVLENGAATVQLDDGGGTKRWSPVLLVPAA